ncbi:hypothetical protein AGMMS49959_07310 [Planctomycetales bacterium]|nr:hypothetical protein AGMMS49959_07310 [Planctomycetales bacterium]
MKSQDKNTPNFNDETYRSFHPDKQPGNYYGAEDECLLTTTTDAEALTRAAKSKDKNQRISAALNYHTPPECLARLLEEDEDDVRKEAADNPPGSLAKAVNDPLMEVRRNAVRNPNTPLSAITVAFDDEDWSVTKALADNPHLKRDAKALANLIVRLADMHLLGKRKSRRMRDYQPRRITDGYFSAAELANLHEQPVERVKKRLSPTPIEYIADGR